MSLTGHCLCGAVTFVAEGVPEKIDACHCEMCRRWGSGPAFSVMVGSVRYQGEDKITRYASSDWAERGFCASCGTSLFYRLVEPDKYFVEIGTFDDQERWVFASQIFTDEKPAFYDFANKTRMMTGAEVLEAFAKGELE